MKAFRYCCLPCTFRASGDDSLTGEVLILHNISRYCDGQYVCNADNGVEPVADKTFDIKVTCKYKSPYVCFLCLFKYDQLFSHCLYLIKSRKYIFVGIKIFLLQLLLRSVLRLNYIFFVVQSFRPTLKSSFKSR